MLSDSHPHLRTKVILSKEDQGSMQILPHIIIFSNLLLYGIPFFPDWKYPHCFNILLLMFLCLFSFPCSVLISFSTNAEGYKDFIHNKICIYLCYHFQLPPTPAHPVNAFQVFTQVQLDFWCGSFPASVQSWPHHHHCQLPRTSGIVCQFAWSPRHVRLWQLEGICCISRFTNHFTE